MSPSRQGEGEEEVVAVVGVVEAHSGAEEEVFTQAP